MWKPVLLLMYWGDPSAQLYLSFVPVEAVVFEVVECSLVASVLGEIGSLVENLLGLELTAGHPLHHFTHGISHRLPDLNTNTHTYSHMKSVIWDLLWWNLCSKVTTSSFYLEMGADLHQHPPCNSDIIGGHQLPLEDGQRNVGTRGQIWVCDWLQGHWGSRGAVCLGVTLECHNLHVCHSLWR